MKKLLTLISVWCLLGLDRAFACEVCKNEQPAGLENITHGTGPQGNLDYIIIWTAVIVVGITLFLSLKYLIKPRENQPGHIKNIVLNENSQ